MFEKTLQTKEIEKNMSADEDSFIVIEETPSMLQFSLLDSLASKRTNEQDPKLDGVLNETTSSLFASALSPSSHTNSVDASPENGKKDENISLQSESMMHSIVSNASHGSSKPFKSNGLQTPTPKSTLAHSFLLGDINCDTMKVSTSASVHSSWIRRNLCTSYTLPLSNCLCAFLFTPSISNDLELFAICEQFELQRGRWKMAKSHPRAKRFKRYATIIATPIPLAQWPNPTSKDKITSYSRNKIDE